MPEKSSLWRGVVAAWAVAVLVFVAFAAVQAIASRRPPSPPLEDPSYVIPKHSQICADGQCRDGASRSWHLDAKDYSVW